MSWNQRCFNFYDPGYRKSLHLMSNWRQFGFFEKQIVDSIQDSEFVPFTTLLQGIQVTCSSTGLFFGDAQGNVHKVDRNLNTLLTFKAYPKRTTQISFVRKKGILITIGEDEQQIPTLKVWQIEKNNGPPVLVRSTKITHGSKVFPVTAMAYLDNLTQVAIGLENGVVILIRGDVSRDRFTKSKIIHEGNEMVTGLGYRIDGADLFLFVTTSRQILIYNCASKELAIPVDNVETSVNGVIIAPQESKQDILISRPEALYLYGPEGKGPCFIIDGEKTLVTWFHGYLVTVSKEPKAITSEFMDQIQIQAQPQPHGTLLSIYDLRGKYVAFRDDFGTRKFDPFASKAIGEPIRHVFSDWGELFVITESNKLYKLHEMDLAHKLEVLYQKNLYNLAMSVVLQPPSSLHNIGKTRNMQELVDQALSNKEDASWSTLMDICKRYGDDLYSKQDFDGSMKQYIRTIGYLEPSFVIRKFLDAQRIHNLTSYLKALHDKQVANGDHTTLLLNCYTKLNDLDHLNEFIDISDAFDVETALIVCRSSGYHQQALRIASKFDQHDWFVKLLVEDLQQFDEAISYFQHIPEDLLKAILGKYGYILVTERPEKMIKVFLENKDLELSIQELLASFVSQPGWCVVFLERLLKEKYEISVDSELPKNVTLDIKEICDNLLELQLALRQGRRGLPNKDVHWDDTILSFLKSPAIQIDLENALFLCKQYKFSKGELVLFEKLGLYEECLQYHITHNDYERALEICIAYGNQNPFLWQKTIAYTAKTSCSKEEPNEKLIRVLKEIQRSQVMTHSEIVQMLANESFISLGMVRPFLLESVVADMSTIKKVIWIVILDS
jgi:vacuolar protein sorting-associated protein 11